ncbi:MAG: PaaX family transcriptional regulator [Myxococcota bacterium]|nr:PaaX family transcriptional regulator [Myxococcota bacterium]
MESPTAKSLVLDLLSTLGGRSMPVSALVAAGTLFEIGEPTLRVAVARLLSAGRIERDERGRYRLGPGAAAIDRRIQSWRRLEERTRPWQGAWAGVHLSGSASRGDRRRSSKALELLGFRELTPGLRVRPDNLSGGVPALRRELADLGLEPGAPVFRMEELSPADEARARSLWDELDLATGYERSLLDLSESERMLDRLAEGDAMVETYLLGGRVLRQLVLDPVLPEPLAPASRRQALAAAMRRYDRLGRTHWSRFLAGHGAPHMKSAARRPSDDGPTRAALH